MDIVNDLPPLKAGHSVSRAVSDSLVQSSHHLHQSHCLRFLLLLCPMSLTKHEPQFVDVRVNGELLNLISKYRKAQILS